MCVVKSQAIVVLKKKERRKIPCKNDEMKIRNMDSVFFFLLSFHHLLQGTMGKFMTPMLINLIVKFIGILHNCILY
jgi:hypothetical protein